MAHNEFTILEKLIILLDDPRNDIFLHIDKKANNFLESNFRHLVKYSDLFLCDRMPISWGGFSQIRCELELLKESTKQPHVYYHLISGVDLPIKTQNEIHAFFEMNSGKEFISYDPRSFSENFSERIQYFHFFQEYLGHRKEKDLYFYVNKLSLKIQQLIGINRIKSSNLEYKKGVNWFSITQDLAEYLVSQQKNIKSQYEYTKAADEIFLNTIAWNSIFRKTISDDSLRLIDWKRGKPYIFRKEDYETLMNSNALWARKFSEQTDPVIIDLIFQHCKPKTFSKSY